MKLTVSPTDFRDALSSVAWCCSPSTVPALANIKATAEDDALTLHAHDPSQGVSVSYTVPAAVARAGSCVLLKDKTLAIAKEAKSSLSISSTESTVDIAFDKAKFALHSYPPDDVPDPTTALEVEPHVLPADALSRAIECVLYAADKRDVTAKFALQSVLFESTDSVLTLAATDTKRLAVYRVPASGPVLTPRLLPLRAVRALKSILPADGTVHAHFGPTIASFRCGPVALHTSYVSGKFPPYTAIIDKTRKNATVSLTISAADFARRVRQAAIMVDTESQRVDFAFGLGTVSLTARGAATGSADVDLALECTSELSIAFDPQYLLDFFGAIDLPTFEFVAKDGTAAAMFRADALEYMVMPLI